MRECGNCKECCRWLIGDAYGWEFGNGKECRFLCETGCSVHSARPKTCRNYYCAWAQELIDEEYRPDKCGVLISVENGDDGQYLKIIEISDKKINTDIINYLKRWSEITNTPVVFARKKSQG